MKHTLTLPFSSACERNKDAILDVLGEYFEELGSILEIGTGTAQHAMHFAQSHRSLSWQTSDRSENLEGIRAQLTHTNLSNVLPPLELDVNKASWTNGDRFDAVYSANTLHIMSEADVLAFFHGLPSVLTSSAWLFVYGPFKYDEQFTSQSNQQFDQSLRSRGVGSAIRDFEWVNNLAEKAGLMLHKDLAMPANNQCLIWRKTDPAGSK